MEQTERTYHDRVSLLNASQLFVAATIFCCRISIRINSLIWPIVNQRYPDIRYLATTNYQNHFTVITKFLSFITIYCRMHKSCDKITSKQHPCWLTSRPQSMRLHTPMHRYLKRTLKSKQTFCRAINNPFFLFFYTIFWL